jgi:hypothetical protein
MRWRVAKAVETEAVNNRTTMTSAESIRSVGTTAVKPSRLCTKAFTSDQGGECVADRVASWLDPPAAEGRSRSGSGKARHDQTGDDRQMENLSHITSGICQ